MSMNPKHVRRLLAAVGTVAVAALLTACGATTPPSPSGSAAADAMKLTVQIGPLADNEYAGNYIAADKGYYAKAGLAPTFITGGPNSPAPEVALASGQVQIAYESNTSRLFSYLVKQQDVVIVGEAFQRTPNGLLSLKRHPVRTSAELSGARIIAGAPNRSSMAALMQINGVKDWTFVPGSPDVGALQAGQGDALLSFAYNQPVALEQQGLKPNQDFYFVPFDKLGYYLMSGVVIVKKSFLQKNRKAVYDFISATDKGWRDAFADPKAATQTVVTKYAANAGLNPAQQEALLKALEPYMTQGVGKSAPLFKVNVSVIKDKVYPSLEKGGITGMPDPATLVDKEAQSTH